MGINLKEQISNSLGDEMRKVEMDVTSSFLNGKICSPLVSAGINTMSSTKNVLGTGLNTAAQAGLYITKDGLQFDPSAATDLVASIANIAVESAKNELISIRNKAWADITYIPDPKIITDIAKSYFSEYITNDLDINKILDFAPTEDKLEKINNEIPEKKQDKITKFVEKTLPKVTSKISETEAKISEYCTYASYYMAFGPSWVSEQIAYGIETASYAISYEVNDITTAVNNVKMEVYELAGNELGKQLSKQYENLLRTQVKMLNDELDTQKSKVQIKAQELLQKANLKIMAKTGIKIPIQKISPENLSKIKNNARLAKMLNMAGGGSSNNEQTSAGKPADETTVLTDKQKLINEMEAAIANHEGYEDPETGQWMAWDDEQNKYVPTHTLSEVDITPSTYTEKEVMNLITQQESFMNNPPVTTV